MNGGPETDPVSGRFPDRKTGPVTDAEVRSILCDLCAARGPGKTICPSEVARALAQDWRPLMPAVQAAVRKLTAQGVIIVTQKGQPVAPATARGPIRLALASTTPGAGSPPGQ